MAETEDGRLDLQDTFVYDTGKTSVAMRTQACACAQIACAHTCSLLARLMAGPAMLTATRTATCKSAATDGCVASACPHTQTRPCLPTCAGAAYYSRPTVDGPLPEQPVHLHPIPWIERESADPLDNKPATEAVSLETRGPFACLHTMPPLYQMVV